MPGFNRRGPEGLGPMTGGGRGLCSSANRSSFNRGDYFTPGAGRGRGFGNCRRQPGTGPRARFLGNAGYRYDDPVREEDLLRNEAEMLKGELEAIEKRLDKIKEKEG